MGRIVRINGMIVCVVKSLRFDLRGVGVFDVRAGPVEGGQQVGMGYLRGVGCWRRATMCSLD